MVEGIGIWIGNTLDSLLGWLLGDFFKGDYTLPGMEWLLGDRIIPEEGFEKEELDAAVLRGQATFRPWLVRHIENIADAVKSVWDFAWQAISVGVALALLPGLLIIDAITPGDGKGLFGDRSAGPNKVGELPVSFPSIDFRDIPDTAAEPARQALRQWVSDMISGLFEWVGSQFTNAHEWLTVDYEETKIITDDEGKVDQVITVVHESLKTKISNIIKNITDPIKEWWTSGDWTETVYETDEFGKLDAIRQVQHRSPQAIWQGIYDSILDFFSSDEMLEITHDDEGRVDQVRKRVRPWVIKHIENIAQAIVDIITDIPTWVSTLWDKFTGLSIWNTIGDALGSLFDRSMTHYDIPADIEAYVNPRISNIEYEEPGEAEQKEHTARLASTLALGAITVRGVQQNLSGTRSLDTMVSTYGKPKPFDTPYAAATGKLGPSIRKFSIAWGGIIGAFLIEHLSAAIISNLGLNILVENVISAIASGFDTALGTQYEEGSAGPYTGTVQEWAMTHAGYIKAAVVLGFAAVFGSPLLATFGIASMVSEAISDDFMSLEQRYQSGELEGDIQGTIQGWRFGILQFINNLTGEGEVDPITMEGLGVAATEIDFILGPVAQIGESMTSAIFDVIAKLPEAGENINQFFKNIFGEGSEDRTSLLNEWMNKIGDIITGFGNTFGNTLIVGSSILAELSASAGRTFRTFAEDGMSEGFVSGVSQMFGSEHGMNALLVSAIAGTIGLAAGGPLTGAIAAIIAPSVLNGLTLAVRQIFEVDLGEALNQEEYRTALSGALGGLIAWALTASHGLGIISAAAVALGTAIGIGTEEGLITYWEENPIAQAVVGAMFGAQFLQPIMASAGKTTTKQKLILGGMTAATALAFQQATNAITSGDPKQQLAAVAGGIAGITITPALLRGTKLGAFGTSIGVALGVIIGAAIVPAMVETFTTGLSEEFGAAMGEAMEGGAPPLGQALGGAMAAVDYGFTAAAGAGTVHMMGRGGIIPDSWIRDISNKPWLQEKILGEEKWTAGQLEKINQKAAERATTLEQRWRENLKRKAARGDSAAQQQIAEAQQKIREQ